METEVLNMADPTEIRDWLADWFLNNTSVEAADLANAAQTNYFEAGWMDSFSFIQFISDIEERFGVSFSNEEFQNREFATLGGLAGIIAKRLGA